MIRMLASVTNLLEAQIVNEAGVDIIDVKNPAAGALGALPCEDVKRVVEVVAKKKPVSATIGDVVIEPTAILTRVEKMSLTGVDYIKIGFLPGEWLPVIVALQPVIKKGTRLIAVLFADYPFTCQTIRYFSEAGFVGVMLDTYNKKRGSLVRFLHLPQLEDFISYARSVGLLTGLAGSLTIEDVPYLKQIAPDYLGFRGALCKGDRIACIDSIAVHQILSAVRKSGPPLWPCPQEGNG